MDKGGNTERIAMRQAAQQQERELATSQQQRIEQPLPLTQAQTLAKEKMQRPRTEQHSVEPLSPKLSEREELIKQMLEKLDFPQQQRQTLKQNGLGL